MTNKPVSVGVIGLGFMGETHVRAYSACPACRIVGVCDASVHRLTGAGSGAGNIGAGDAQPLFDPGAVRTWREPGELLADPEIELVSICTPTDTHVELAIAALDAGKHVLVEKPVAISLGEVTRLRDHASGSGRLCVPGMCIRFWPGWDSLIELIRSGRHGRVLSARFERLGAAPEWSGFYADPARSGDAIFDLHIHDADFVHACFGEPSRVRSVGSPRHVSTTYSFDDADAPLAVIAEGGWLNDPRAAFRMRYVVEFERALAEFDLGADPPVSLLVHGDAPVTHSPTQHGWERQIGAVVRAVATGEVAGLPTLDDACAVTQTLECELESLRTGGEVRVPPARRPPPDRAPL